MLGVEISPTFFFNLLVTKSLLVVLAFQNGGQDFRLPFSVVLLGMKGDQGKHTVAIQRSVTIAKY